MTNLSVFNFETNSVRIVTGENGEPLFVGKDVCGVLGYSNHNDAVNDHCKGVAIRRKVQTSGGVQEMRVLTEVDTLRLILSTTKESAKVAQDTLVARLAETRSVIKALSDIEVPDDLPDMFVYAIRNTLARNIKIGISRNPVARLKQLQLGNDCQLELVAYRPAHNRFADERALHIENQSNRIAGEWFSDHALQSFQ